MGCCGRSNIIGSYSRNGLKGIPDNRNHLRRGSLSGIGWVHCFFFSQGLFCNILLILVKPAQEWRHMHIEDILSMPDKWVLFSRIYYDVTHVLSFISYLQVGISVLRSLGHGISLHSFGCRRPCLCEIPTRLVDKGVVHET